ncbi:MAG: hypothetical protein ACHQ7M_21235, partial [Chloroflexota bacterium]
QQTTPTYLIPAEERRARLAAQAGARMGTVPTFPNSSDWLGRFRNLANAGNDYMIDRDDQRTNDYAGMPSDASTEDQAMIESMGAIYTRQREHLGTSDSGIIRTRQRLLKAVRAFRDHGTVPPGVDNPEVYRQRSGYIKLARTADWWEDTKELRERYEADLQAPMQTVAP